MNSKGFTMLELLMAIAVMAILTSVSFYGYNAKREKLILDSEVNNIVGEIEHMREMAIASQAYQKGEDMIIPKGGYGVILEISSPGAISRIADFDGLGFDKSDDVLSNLILDGRVIIKSLVSDQGARTSLTILYRFPFPNAQIIDDTTATSSNAYMVIGLKSDPSQEKRIHFNSAGLIYAQ